MTGLDIQNPFREKAYQIAQLPLQTGILPHAEKIGIRFQNMQMGIHRLALVLILGAEAHVGYFSPFAGQGFAITVFHGVEAMLFNGLEQTDGICQRFIIARGTGIFTQPVDGEPQSINLLLGIERIAFIVERPVNSTKFIVIETVDKSTFGTRSRFQILRPLQQAVCSREGPQDAGVQDCPLFCFGLHLLPARDTAVETAVHFIRHSIYPEGEDIGNQLLLHLLFHLLDIHKFLSYEL